MTTETDTAPAGWRLTPSELALTREKLAKLNARAVKRGFTGRLALDATPCEWVETMPDGSRITRRGFSARVTGDAPRIEGWEFAAVIVVTYNAKDDSPTVVVNPVPGSDVVIRNADVRPGECDHCHVQRNRTKLYAVRGEDGVTLQVGSTCLKDFLGWSALPVILTESGVQGALGGVGGSSDGWAIEDVLAWAGALVARDGFRPSGSTGSTRDRVSTALSYGRQGQDLRRSLADFISDAEAEVPEIQRVIGEAFADAEYGYEANLRALTRPGAVVEWKTLGLAVSAISAHARIVERKLKDQIERERRAAAVESSRWLGTVGDKVEVTGTITRRDYYPSDYYGRAGSYLIVLDSDGSDVVTFSSAGWTDVVAVGDVVTLVGTVKAHETYRDIKQTKLTRPKRVG